MKTHSLMMLLFLVASSSLAQHAYTEKQVIAYAKAIDVKTLDPSLPSQSLEDWLQSGPPRAHIWYWTMEDTCDLKPDSSSADYPLCARITFSRGGEAGYVLVQVGTANEGISGRPQLYGGVGVGEEGSGVATGTAERLSDLPMLLDQPPVTDGVRKLYEEIVAHHPLGIPTGAEKAAMWPLLSKRLTEQLQTAQACEDDYLRQHQTTASTMKPAWLKTGLFSGDGKRASPIYSVLDRKELQKDGSFLVYVDFAYKYIDERHKSFSGDDMWQVTTRVIAENGRFVIDDVRMFSGKSADGSSHLLSDAFVGCQGPRWVGQSTANN